MKTLVKYLFLFFSLIYLGYLALPTPQFPKPIPGSLESTEPADSETPFRKGYFTDMSREEVLTYYQDQMSHSSYNNIPLITYRRNYRPEDAYGIIRDQTRSTFLEEIIHPFRESLYVNGFEPKDNKDRIFIDEKEWRQKVTVKWVPSSVYARLSVGVLTLIAVWLVFKHSLRIIKEFYL